MSFTRVRQNPLRARPASRQYYDTSYNFGEGSLNFVFLPRVHSRVHSQASLSILDAKVILLAVLGNDFLHKLATRYRLVVEVKVLFVQDL